MSYADYEAVIGLEVHAELKTESKIFCSCSTSFGAEPNTHCCPICLGFPGTLPILNRRAVELAVMAGAALNCEISNLSRIDRKQYFYPDLPKSYQISQADSPICKNGYLDIQIEEGELRVGITRIHIEEDAGKLIHNGEHTLVDANRCGVPLIEIVSSPDLRTGKQAAAYVRALRSILTTCEISDGRMQEGSLRCDVNISVRRRTDAAFGTRTEIKNLNSFTFIEKAIDYEFARHCKLLERGEALPMETRRYDPATGKTYPMRTKEQVSDYRFLREPDLPPIYLTDGEIKRLCASLPELPAARAARLGNEYGVRPHDAAVLTANRALADYYEAAAIDGAGIFARLRHITLPQLLPLMVINFVGAFIAAFQGMGSIFLLTFGGPGDATNVLSLAIWKEAYNNLRFSTATTMAWFLGVALIGFSYLQIRYLRRVEFRSAATN